MEMQRLGQAHLRRAPQLHEPAAAGGPRARALQDPQLELRAEDAEGVVQRQDGRPQAVDAHVARLRRGGDDARAAEAHVERRRREGRQQAEREQEVADAARAGGGEDVLEDVARRAQAGDAPGDEAGAVGEGRAGVGDLDGRAVGDGFEEAEEGDLVCGQAGAGG